MDKRFMSAEDALLWSVKNDKNDNRSFCNHDDVLIIIERLFRNRIINFEHINVMKHYSLRQEPPKVERYREKKAYYLWKEAMYRITPAMIIANIVVKKKTLAELSAEIKEEKNETTNISGHTTNNKRAT